MNDTKVLLHVDEDSIVGDVINGKPIRLPANEPVELDAFIADAIVNHIGHLYGIVIVNQVRTKTGVTWDVEEAQDRAENYLKECEKTVVDFYIRQQMEDRIAIGKPALPPTGRALDVIKANRINLRKQYGITPVGWADPDSNEINTFGANTSNDAAVAALKSVVELQNQQITTQNQQITDLSAKFERLMKTLQGPEDTNQEYTGQEEKK